MRKLCCVLYLLLFMQPAFAADVSVTGKMQAMLAPNSSDAGLPPSLSVEDDPDVKLTLSPLSHSSPVREQRYNSKNYIPHLSLSQAFQPRGPPHICFA